MKTRKLGRKVTTISNSRWATYAAASAATALAGVSGAEAEIHYSGLINHELRNSAATFALDPGANLQFAVGVPRGGSESGGFGKLKILGSDNHSLGGFAASHPQYAGVYLYDLGPRVNLSGQNFTNSCIRYSSSLICYGGTIGGGPGRFQDRGTGFIGFVFNKGAGNQYGWARVKTSGAPHYRFTLVDYAWGDPGDPLFTAQKRSIQTGNAVPATGSLGMLAIGGAGLLAWRRSRASKARS